MERIKRAGLCVTMAMTSLCHFCDRPSRCKSDAEDRSYPPSPHYPFIGTPAQQQLHFHLFSCQKSVSLLVLTRSPHHTAPQWRSLSCGSVCMFCVECPVAVRSHLLLLYCVVQLRKKVLRKMCVKAWRFECEVLVNSGVCSFLTVRHFLLFWSSAHWIWN